MVNCRAFQTEQNFHYNNVIIKNKECYYIYIYSSPLLILINPHQTPEDSPFTLFTFFSVRPFYRAFARGLEVAKRSGVLGEAGEVVETGVAPLAGVVELFGETVVDLLPALLVDMVAQPVAPFHLHYLDTTDAQMVVVL